MLTTVTYDGWTNRATIIPRTALAGRSIDTIRLTTGIKDLSGNALAADHAGTFTT